MSNLLRADLIEKARSSGVRDAKAVYSEMGAKDAENFFAARRTYLIDNYWASLADRGLILPEDVATLAAAWLEGAGLIEVSSTETVSLKVK